VSGGLPQLLTIGDLARDSRFEAYSRRQIEYAIQAHGIAPTGHVGIIRTFTESQIGAILGALHRTARHRTEGRAHG